MDPSLLGRPIPTPTAHRPTGVMTKRTLLLLVGIGVALIIGGILLMGSGDKSGSLQEHLSARQATTLKIIADGQKNISDEDLAKINSELNIVLESDDVGLQGALKTAGFKKAEATIVTAEADLATFEKLKSAKLNAAYDTTYRTILSQRLESLRALLKELNSATTSRSLKAATAKEYTHLGGYQTTLDALKD